MNINSDIDGRKLFSSVSKGFYFLHDNVNIYYIEEDKNEI